MIREIDNDLGNRHKLSFENSQNVISKYIKCFIFIVKN